MCGPGRAYPGRAVRGAAPGKQQPDDVQVVVMDSHVQGSQAILQGTRRQRQQPSLSWLPTSDPSGYLSAAALGALYRFFHIWYSLVKTLPNPVLI